MVAVHYSVFDSQQYCRSRGYLVGRRLGGTQGRRKAAVVVCMSCVRCVIVIVERDFVRHPLKIFKNDVYNVLSGNFTVKQIITMIKKLI